mmetsp:Transcript_97546/g.119478  ORF Transcript_97546/g.119478 Transcript_97546/m.119478 type:complete len:240 (-) Transcript_97546:1064-1783(-)
MNPAAREEAASPALCAKSCAWLAISLEVCCAISAASKALACAALNESLSVTCLMISCTRSDNFSISSVAATSILAAWWAASTIATPFPRSWSKSKPFSDMCCTEASRLPPPKASISFCIFSTLPSLRFTFSFRAFNLASVSAYVWANSELSRMDTANLAVRTSLSARKRKALTSNWPAGIPKLALSRRRACIEILEDTALEFSTDWRIHKATVTKFMKKNSTATSKATLDAHTVAQAAQ